MPKFTIYVSDALKADMDKADGSDPKPNWSAVAQDAFRVECERVASRKRSKTKVNDVVERLRASKHKSETQDTVAGHRGGRFWAQKHASYEELKYAANWQPDDAPVELWRVFNPTLEEWSERDALEFWEMKTTTDGPPSDAFVVAFAEGAAEIWNEVADKL